MSFNYNKKEQSSQDSFWTSYSDLFLGLSTIFLLLYVTASLRTGTEGLRSQIENQKLTRQVEEMENQLKMYESVKNEYLANQATKDETQEYQELMDKLTLLQEDAKTEKERLLQEAVENQNKVKALNKYQQMVRNVLNANKMAKSKIVHRDDLIKEQDVEIEGKEIQISDLSKDIAVKKNLIAKNEAQIKQTQEALEKRKKELSASYRANKISKNLYQKKLSEAQAAGQSKVAQYQAQLQQTSSELQAANAQYQAISSELAQTNAQLGAAQGNLAKTQGLLKQKEGEVLGLSAQASALGGQLSKTQGLLEKKEGEAAGLAARAASLSGKLNQTQGELARARAEIEARKSVAGEIQKGFAKAGVKADIDLETGDVVLDFGQTYFDSDSDRLKKEMKGVLEKAMPIYSKSLFGNPKVSNKVSAVEVIGFASPTYQGRYVDPQSARSEDKAALKYNMDLSYRRANSIFTYLLDERENSNFEHQKELLSLMKVSGRSFLEVMKVQNRNVASAADFCRQNDCKKAQRVIIRFSMDQKK